MPSNDSQDSKTKPAAAEVAHCYAGCEWKVAHDALKAKYDELISYMPKIPTELYEKRMAREIERLKRELSEARKAIDHITKGIPSEWAFSDMRKQRDEAIERGDRMRAALEQIAKDYPGWAVGKMAEDAIKGGK